MTANELRIGNCVWSNIGHYDRVEDTITAIKCDRVSTRYCKMAYMPIENIEPIPLTEQWLLRMGFEFMKGIWVKEGFFCCVVLGENGWKHWVNIRHNNLTIALIINVHQLQNLYFALTGEEITIKEQ